MTATVFDAWAALDVIQRGHIPAKPANPANSARLADLAPLAGGQGPQRESHDRAAFLLRAAEDAIAALAGPELGPVLQVGEVDHDDAERDAMVEHYAAPEAVPQAEPGLVYCFPCGKPVLLRSRTWSETGGWCCAACAAKRAANGGIP
jgi:hypothetical protein